MAQRRGAVSWTAPCRYSAVEDLTTVELRSRELAVGHLELYRAAALGFSDAFLMLGAPQIGFATAGGSPACAR
jgi:hypothetical protein